MSQIERVLRENATLPFRNTDVFASDLQFIVMRVVIFSGSPYNVGLTACGLIDRMKGRVLICLTGAYLSAPILAAQSNAPTGFEDLDEDTISYPQLSRQTDLQTPLQAVRGFDENSYLSFNRNRRLAASEGVSFDSSLGQLSLSNKVALNAFTRVNDLEQHYGMGLNFYDSQLTLMQGQGEGFSRLANQYTNLDPYYFHGGTTADFRFSSVELAHRFNPVFSVQGGRTEIRSRYREQRYTDFVGARLGDFNTSFMQISRGQEKVGESFSLGYASSLGQLNWSSVNHVQGGQINSLSWSYRAASANQYGLSFSSQRNPLTLDDGSFRVMVSFSKPLGHIQRMAAADAGAVPQEPSVNYGNLALLGGAALGVGLMLSSGSDGQDSSVRLSDQHAAARAAVNKANPVSVDQNREYGGYVYSTPDGRYTSTDPVAGTIDSVDLPFSLIPKGGRALASYHTHGAADPRYVNEQFSPTDIASDNAINLDGYLGTPAGNFLWHNVRDDSVQVLGRIAN